MYVPVYASSLRTLIPTSTHTGTWVHEKLFSVSPSCLTAQFRGAGSRSEPWTCGLIPKCERATTCEPMSDSTATWEIERYTFFKNGIIKNGFQYFVSEQCEEIMTTSLQIGRVQHTCEDHTFYLLTRATRKIAWCKFHLYIHLAHSIAGIGNQLFVEEGKASVGI